MARKKVPKKKPARKPVIKIGRKKHPAKPPGPSPVPPGNGNTFNGCPEVGRTKQGTPPPPQKQAENKLKNRNTAPPKINPGITLEAILAPGNDVQRWSINDGATVTGYLANAVQGGPEECNCEQIGEPNVDTHLEIVADMADTSGPKVFIVEFTPRWKAKNPNWTTPNMLALKGKRVQVTGWMFFDPDHQNESQNTKAPGANVWRATAWEIHPITAFQVLP